MNNDEENIVWFAMRAPFCKELEAKRLLDKQAIENFVPMCYKVFEKNNKKRKELVPAVHNLIFVPPGGLSGKPKEQFRFCNTSRCRMPVKTLL